MRVNGGHISRTQHFSNVGKGTKAPGRFQKHAPNLRESRKISSQIWQQKHRVEGRENPTLKQAIFRCVPIKDSREMQSAALQPEKAPVKIVPITGGEVGLGVMGFVIVVHKSECTVV